MQVVINPQDRLRTLVCTVALLSAAPLALAHGADCKMGESCHQDYPTPVKTVTPVELTSGGSGGKEDIRVWVIVTPNDGNLKTTVPWDHGSAGGRATMESWTEYACDGSGGLQFGGADAAVGQTGMKPGSGKCGDGKLTKKRRYVLVTGSTTYPTGEFSDATQSNGTCGGSAPGASCKI